MSNRGRPSAASLAVAAIGPSGITSSERPKPAPELTKEQAVEWRVIVNRMPADWFQAETLPLLSAYCRHIVSARRVASLIQAAEQSDDFDLIDYDRLLKMQERESRCLSSLSVKMRISQSTTYDKSKKKPAQKPKPWES